MNVLMQVWSWRTVAAVAAVVGVALVVVVAVMSTPARAAGYQRFASPVTAAKRLTVAARAEGVHLFHPCAAVNPYLIRCGGFVSGVAPLTKSGRLRVSIVWRKLNPYMLEKTVYALGGVFQHRFVDTKVPY
jgi:hypothetical protein